MSKNFAAVIPKPHGRLEVVERAIPKPGPDELLVRNHIVAINPVDWKIQDYDFSVKAYPSVLGSDVASKVVSVGSNVTEFKAGDRVTGFAPSIESSNPDHGAFQTYTILRALATTKLPDNISDEQAVVLPMQVATAGDGIFRILGLPTRQGQSPPLGEGFLLWGGTTSIGVGALQMAKALGFTTYVTASAKHHAYLKELGADLTFDYRDPGVVDAIMEAARANGERVRYGYDFVGSGTPNSAVTTGKIVSKLAEGPAKMATTVEWPKDVSKPENLTVDSAAAFLITTEHADLGRWLFHEYLPQALADGTLKSAPPVERVGSGLKDVQKAFDLQKAGVSCKKVVVPLA